MKIFFNVKKKNLPVYWKNEKKPILNKKNEKKKDKHEHKNEHSKKR